MKINLLMNEIYRPAPKNEDEMMEAIFECIDRLFRIVRPRKLLYMAIDGVVRNLWVFEIFSTILFWLNYFYNLIINFSFSRRREQRWINKDRVDFVPRKKRVRKFWKSTEFGAICYQRERIYRRKSQRANILIVIALRR